MTEYVVVIEHGDTSFGAYSPDLPGCVAVGETEQEVEHRMREAIGLHIENLRAHGDPVPVPRASVRYIAV